MNRLGSSFEEEMLSCEEVINQLFDEDSDVYVFNSDVYQPRNYSLSSNFER